MVLAYSKKEVFDLVFIVNILAHFNKDKEVDQATRLVGPKIIPYAESRSGMIVLLITPIKYQWSILSQ